jgi:hypothetical protein
MRTQPRDVCKEVISLDASFSLAGINLMCAFDVTMRSFLLANATKQTQESSQILSAFRRDGIAEQFSRPAAGGLFAVHRQAA